MLATSKLFKQTPKDTSNELRTYVYNMIEEDVRRGWAEKDALVNHEQLLERGEKIRTMVAKNLKMDSFLHCEMDPEITWEKDCGEYNMKGVILQSRPGVYMTTNLYIPKNAAFPAPAILFVCGHANEAKGYPEYQSVCISLVRNGFIVLAQDPISQGERPEYYINGKETVDRSVFSHSYAGGQAIINGRPLASYFLHDSVRALDYLYALPEVDKSRIGITGNSGGGTQTSLMMLYERRLAAAAPATFITAILPYMLTDAPQDDEQNVCGIGGMGFDHDDIFLAFYPRPSMILCVTQDFFPIEGTKLTAERVKKYYETGGYPDLFRIAEDDTNHWYSPPLASAALDFFCKFLKGEKPAIPCHTKVLDVRPEDTFVTPTGSIFEFKPSAATLFTQQLEEFMQFKAKRLSLPQRQAAERAKNWLTERVEFSGRGKPSVSDITCYDQAITPGLEVKYYTWMKPTGMTGNAVVFLPAERKGIVPATWLITEEGTLNLPIFMNEVYRETNTGRAVIVADFSGAGALEQKYLNRYTHKDMLGTLYKMDWDLQHMGDSLAALRVYDLLCAFLAAEKFEGIQTAGAKILTLGRACLYGGMAALLCESAISINTLLPVSYEDMSSSRFYNPYLQIGFVLPGASEYFDLPQLQSWIDGGKV